MWSLKFYDADQRVASFVTQPQVLLEAETPSVSVVVHQETRFQAERVVGRDHFDKAVGPLVRDLEWLGGAESCCPQEPGMAARGQQGCAPAAAPPLRPGRDAYFIAMRPPREHTFPPAPRGL